MPTIQIYLSQEAYVRLVQWGEAKGHSGSQLAQEWLKQILGKDDLGKRISIEPIP